MAGVRSSPKISRWSFPTTIATSGAASSSFSASTSRACWHWACRERQTSGPISFSKAGLRPRDLLVTAFRLVCLHLGVECILAVSDRCRVASNAYFKSSVRVLSSYDDAWIENGGRLTAEGFFKLKVQPGQRDVHDIASRKRAQYRRRYAMLDTLSRQISDGLDQASRKHTTS